MNSSSNCIMNTRAFSSTLRLWKKFPDKLKGKGKSSQDWLIRQMNDPYVKKAKIENYRARSAFKLLELQARTGLMRPGDVVLECGAAPGAWSQVALRATNADRKDQHVPVGYVIGVDLLSVRPLPPAVHIQGDFTAAETQRRLLALLPAPPRLLLSDMAPSASGVRQLDQERIVALCASVVRFGVRHLAPGGSLLVKLWASAGEVRLRHSLAPFFRSVRTLKPDASRSESAECYLLATQFVGATERTAGATGRTVGAIQETTAAVEPAVRATETTAGAIQATVRATERTAGAIRATVRATEPTAGAIRATVRATEPTAGAIRATVRATEPTAGAIQETVRATDPTAGAIQETIRATELTAAETEHGAEDRKETQEWEVKKALNGDMRPDCAEVTDEGRNAAPPAGVAL